MKFTTDAMHGETIYTHEDWYESIRPLSHDVVLQVPRPILILNL